MGSVLIPVTIVIIGVIAFVGVLTYLADKSAARHDRG